MRILDPSGATTDWLQSQFPDAEIHRVPDEKAPYDAAMLYGDLDNRCDPAARLAELSQHVARPDGRIYASVREGTKGGMSRRTPGRRRAWQSVDVADLLRRFGVLEEFGVDENGYISASIAPSGKSREIAVWTGYAIGPWDPMDIVNRGLGGSETAAYRLAETLSEMGYIVTLYGHFVQEGALKDVILKHFQRFDPTVDRRAVITFRNGEMFDLPLNAETKILWLEDVAGGEGLNERRAENLDYVVGVSEWHAENIRETYPWLDSAKVIASRNGITPSYFVDEGARDQLSIAEGKLEETRELAEDWAELEPLEATVLDARAAVAATEPEREKRLLYTSSPDRGLDIVLECWPEVLKRVPDATLFHTYGPWYDIVAGVSPETASHRARCRELASAFPESIKAVGPLGQQELAMLMRSSLVWCAPSYFSLGKVKFCETSCISAMEAQAAGCRVVCSNWGALKETVKTGVKIDGDPTGPEWRARFVDEIVAGLTDPDVQVVAQTEGPAAVEHNDWYPVCRHLETLWDRQTAEIEDGLVVASV